MSTRSSQLPAASTLDGVPDEWADAHLATVFSRWHPFVTRFQREPEALLIAESGAQPGDTVLDVGCGSGVPSLRLAEIVGPYGRVVAVDPSSVFLAAVTENARQAGLTNVETVQASAAGLPFAANQFDAATSHMGVMFFSDPVAGLARIRETLKTGRRAAFVAWGPDVENEMIGAFWSAAAPHLPPDPQPDPAVAEADIPKPSRFAAEGSLSNVLQQAGFRDVRERYELVTLVWPGHAPTFLDFWLELTRLGEHIPESRRQQFEDDVLDSFGRHAHGDEIHLSAVVVVASGAA